MEPTLTSLFRGYAQWLIRAEDQDLLHRHAPGRFNHLEPDEVLLEGAFTFAAFRSMGAMADGMAQLLRIAAGEGATSALTYVAIDNVPSLRGCANVKFDLDHVTRQREATRTPPQLRTRSRCRCKSGLGKRHRATNSSARYR